eukprot:EG_transcript_7097
MEHWNSFLGQPLGAAIPMIPSMPLGMPLQPTKPLSKEGFVSPNGRTAQVKVYCYNPEIRALELDTVKLRQVMMELKPFGCGGVSEAFRIWFLDEANVPGPMQVAKRYKFKMGFAEDHTVCVMGRELAVKFNELVKNTHTPYPPVKFLSWNTIVELEDEFYSIEDFLPGRFTKFNNIFGATEKIAVTAEDLVQCNLAAAYSHFSWVGSDHSYIILDVQGVGTTYTDIAVVSRRVGQYGYTDTGPDNIVRFFQNHKCNELCHALDLRPVDPATVLDSTPEAGSGGSPGDEAAAGEPAKLPRVEWVYVDAEGTPHRYDPEVLRAIEVAEKQDEPQIQVLVGSAVHHIINLASRTHFNVGTGDAFRLELRQVVAPRQLLLQVELDDEEWHCYNAQFQAEVLAAVQSGAERASLPMCGRTYEFDFVGMTQTNLESGKQRRIRLVEVEG